jgi:D-alanyl-D-alanine dipeptidase
MKRKIATISELKAIVCMDNHEPLVDLSKEARGVHTDYRRSDTGLQAVIVRKTVAKKLLAIQKRLEKHDRLLKLIVVEGYRPMVYQERYFLKTLFNQSDDPMINVDDVLEKCHQFVAMPAVAGHPTAGAVDVTIAYGKEEIDMGGAIADFTIPGLLPTYSSLATSKQAENRQWLHDLMIAEGFAPFYGEWWHFSYGDCEWAAFYDEPAAIYGPVSPDRVARADLRTS